MQRPPYSKAITVFVIAQSIALLAIIFNIRLGDLIGIPHHWAIMSLNTVMMYYGIRGVINSRNYLAALAKLDVLVEGIDEDLQKLKINKEKIA